jgi:hypothetical protein
MKGVNIFFVICFFAFWDFPLQALQTLGILSTCNTWFDDK